MLPGGLSIKTWSKLFPLHTFIKKSEPPEVLPPLHNSNDDAIHRKWANNLGAKLPNLKTNFAEIWKAPQHGSCNPASQLPCVQSSSCHIFSFEASPTLNDKSLSGSSGDKVSDCIQSVVLGLCKLSYHHFTNWNLGWKPISIDKRPHLCPIKFKQFR